MGWLWDLDVPLLSYEDPKVFATLPFFPLHCVEPFTAAFSVFSVCVFFFGGVGGGRGGRKHNQIQKYIKLFKTDA